MSQQAQNTNDMIDQFALSDSSKNPCGHAYHYTDNRGDCGQFQRGREEALVEPPTAQQPHPPFWMGAGSPASIEKVAERGYNLLLDQFASVDATVERI